jgi:hypothetical protein
MLGFLPYSRYVFKLIEGLDNGRKFIMSAYGRQRNWSNLVGICEFSHKNVNKSLGRTTVNQLTGQFVNG